jgi:hypothetical protein
MNECTFCCPRTRAHVEEVRAVFGVGFDILEAGK